jgi:hypothetical protein
MTLHLTSGSPPVHHQLHLNLTCVLETSNSLLNPVLFFVSLSRTPFRLLFLPCVRIVLEHGDTISHLTSDII